MNKKPRSDENNPKEYHASPIEILIVIVLAILLIVSGIAFSNFTEELRAGGVDSEESASVTASVMMTDAISERQEDQFFIGPSSRSDHPR